MIDSLECLPASKRATIRVGILPRGQISRDYISRVNLTLTSLAELCLNDNAKRK